MGERGDAREGVGEGGGGRRVDIGEMGMRERGNGEKGGRVLS